jgi:hypothetical protein
MSLLITKSAVIITLQVCTTLPTRYKDYAAHPTNHVGWGGTRINRSQQALVIEGMPSLRRESPMSIGDTLKPLYTAPLATHIGPSLNDQDKGGNELILTMIGYVVVAPTSSTNGS